MPSANVYLDSLINAAHLLESEIKTSTDEFEKHQLKKRLSEIWAELDEYLEVDNYEDEEWPF